jgi:hypothetical protein
MSDEVLRTIINVMAYLSDLLVFLVAVLAAYLTLQQPKIRVTLGETSILVQVVSLVALTGLLASVGSRIVGDFMALPRSRVFSSVSGFYASVEFMGALISIGGLVAASRYMLKQSNLDKG